MRTITIVAEEDMYDRECHRIVQVFADRDFSITLKQAKILWGKYSESLPQDWHGLPASDEEVWLKLGAYWLPDETHRRVLEGPSNRQIIDSHDEYCEIMDVTVCNCKQRRIEGG